MNLADAVTWRAELGLLPVPLFHDTVFEGAYVLLNGARGNFCLDLRAEVPPEQSRSEAWSANVGHSLALRDNKIVVRRWDRHSGYGEEVYSQSDVSDRLESFHRFLEKTAPDADRSIVAHLLSVFRSVRAALGDKYDGQQALQSYLYLIATATSNVPRGSLDPRSWGLNASSAEFAQRIREGEWLGLMNLLQFGRRADRLEPNLALMLRHASGALFQEAHFAAQFSAQDQFLLDGFAPSPVTVRADKSVGGVHFTPAAIARSVVEEALVALRRSITTLPDEVTVFDPACGSAEFLREVLRQLRLSKYQGRVRLIGWDISPAACEMASFVLSWEAQERGLEIVIEIVCQDALEEGVDWPANATIIAMNPPFRAWRDMSSEQQLAVRNTLGPLAKGRPDLASAFLWNAVRSLSNGGVLGTVLPASFLDGESMSAFREALGSAMVPTLIARLGSQSLFHQAQVDPALYVGTRRIEGVSATLTHSGAETAPLALAADYRPVSASTAIRSLRRARWQIDTNPQVDPFPIVGQGFSVYRNPKIGTGNHSWAPRPYKEWRMLLATSALPRVRSSFNLQQGALTGLNRAFVVSRDEWSNFPDHEKPYFRPAVMNESITRAMLIDAVYVFFPHGGNEIADEASLKAAVPTYFDLKVKPNLEALKKRTSVHAGRWWELWRPRRWQEDLSPKIVSTYFGDSGSFAWDESGDFVVVQGYGWLPRARKVGKTTALAYLALLNSRVFGALLAASSNNVGGGQWNLSARFVEPMPLPDLTSGVVQAGLVKDLSSLGGKMHKGDFSWDGADAAMLEDVAALAFGVAPASI